MRINERVVNIFPLKLSDHIDSVMDRARTGSEAMELNIIKCGRTV